MYPKTEMDIFLESTQTIQEDVHSLFKKIDLCILRPDLKEEIDAKCLIF